MTLYEKTLLPLILGNDIRREDLSEESGFVDTYTEDLDYDDGVYPRFYIMVNDTIRTNKSIEFARKLSKSVNLHSEYCKIIDGVPYRIYDFYVPFTLKKMENGLITPTYEQRTKIIDFWGFMEDISCLLISNYSVMVETDNAIPLEDEMTYAFEKLI